MWQKFQKRFSDKKEGQALVEFALVIPVLLMLIVGTFEFARIMFVYTTVTNSAREAARYGIAAGIEPMSNRPYYLDCAGIRQAAKSTVVLATLADDDIEIFYHQIQPGSTGSTAFTRGPDCGELSNSSIKQGDQVAVEVTYELTPIIANILGNFIPDLTIRASSSRTILKNIIIGEEGRVEVDEIPPGCVSVQRVPVPLRAGYISIAPAPNCGDTRYYQEGTTLRLTAVSDNVDLYTFLKWAGNVVEGIPPGDARITGNPLTYVIPTGGPNTIQAIAVFQSSLPCYDVNRQILPSPVAGSIRITPSQECVLDDSLNTGWHQGTELRFTANASDGYDFDFWSDDLSGTDNPVDMVITGDMTATANFRECYTLERIARPAAGGSINVLTHEECPGGWFENTIVEFEALPNENYRFVDWGADASDSGTTNPTTIEMIGHLTAQANFATDLTCYPFTMNIDPPDGGVINFVPGQTCDGGWLGTTPPTVIGIEAVPLGGFAFDGWSNVFPIVDTPSPTSTNPLTFTMNTTRSITANFFNISTDLSITKVDDPDPVYVNSPLTYTIEVLNLGPETGTGVRVVDNLPTNVTFSSAATSQGSCAAPDGANQLVCNLGSIPVGNTAQVTVTVFSPGFATTISNEAFVSSDQVDTDTSNNSAVVNTTVENAADLSISKVGDLETLFEGEILTYDLTVTNNGPGNATGVVISDTLPENTAYVGVSGSDCNYDRSTHVVTCFIGNMAAGETVVRSIQVIPTQATTGSGSTVVHDLDATDDTYISSAFAERSTNFNSSDPRISVLNLTGSSHYGLVKFDLSAIPTRSTVNSSVLNLKINRVDGIDGGSYQVNFYALTTDWDEGTVNYDLICPASICAFDPGSLYAVQGTPMGGTSISVDVTALTQQWVDGILDNYGIVMIVTGQNNKEAVFEVHETGASSAPELLVEIVEPTPGMTNTAEVTLTDFDPVLENNRDTEETDVDPGGAYILANPVCGESGDSITITGYNWPDQRKRLIITWDPAGPDTTIEIMNTNNYDVTGGTWSETIIIPAGSTDGVHTVEVNHGDNPIERTTFKIPCPAPNLIISEPTLLTPLPITTSQTLQYQVTITNVGDLDASSQFVVGLYFDPPAPGPADTHIDISYRVAQVSVTGLAFGDSRVVNLIVSSGFSTAGAHEVYAVVDSDPGPIGNITERVEFDNISNAVTTIVDGSGPIPTPAPTATPPTDPSTIAGQAFIIGSGGQTLPQANVEVNLYNEVTGGTLLLTTFTNDGGIYVFTSVPPSTYTITACINIDGTEYFYPLSGVVVPPASTVLEDLYLTEAPCL